MTGPRVWITVPTGPTPGSGTIELGPVTQGDELIMELDDTLRLTVGATLIVGMDAPVTVRIQFDERVTADIMAGLSDGGVHMLGDLLLGDDDD